jgi:hypothetical protein
MGNNKFMPKLFKAKNENFLKHTATINNRVQLKTNLVYKYEEKV